MSNLITSPFPVFTDVDGSELENGYIFIGEYGLDPLTHPLQAYWDAALTVPANNIRTRGGYANNSGSPGRLYVDSNYSILVQDKNGDTVYQQLTVEPIEAIGDAVDISISDAGGYYTSDNVEGALQEVPGIAEDIFDTASRIEAEAIGTVKLWPWAYSTIPTGFVAMLGSVRTKTDDLWTKIGQYAQGSDRFHFQSVDTNTYKVPDWTGITVRGAVYVEVEPSEWDDTNNWIELDYDNLPNGTPIVANETAGGLTAGTTYYLAVDTVTTNYRVYTTESDANANDGTTNRVTLTAITSAVVLTGSGEFQDKTMWGHWHKFVHNSSGTGKQSANGNILALTESEEAVQDAITDGVHDTPEISNESRMANVQGIWIIKAEHTTLTPDESDSLSQRVEDLENAAVPAPFETPWINRSDWTNVHLGSNTTKDVDSNVTHGFGTLLDDDTVSLSDLDVKVFLSPTGSDSDMFEIGTLVIGTGGVYRADFTAYQVDKDNILIQTGLNGLLAIDTDGTGIVITTQDWYYKIRVTVNQGKTFIQAKTNANPVLHVQHREGANTSGGNSSSGDNQRTLNTILKNTITGASWSTSTYDGVIPIGTYKISGFAGCYDGNNHKVRVEFSDGQVVHGSAAYAPSTANALSESTIPITEIEFTEIVSMEMLHRISTGATGGLGAYTTGETVNLYADLRIEKIG